MKTFEIKQKLFGTKLLYVVIEHGECPLRYFMGLFESRTKTRPYSQYCGETHTTGCGEYDTSWIEPFKFESEKEVHEYIKNRIKTG